jgi:hypothetical protein
MGNTSHQFRISRLPFHMSLNRDAVGHVNDCVVADGVPRI